MGCTDNLRDLLGIKRIDKVPNARIRQLCGVTKDVDEKIDEGVLRWFGHMKRMENDRTAMLGSVLVLAQWLGRGRDGLGCQVSKDNGA